LAEPPHHAAQTLGQIVAAYVSHDGAAQRASKAA
jgi:hypothetical protein